MHCGWSPPAKWLQKIDDCHEISVFCLLLWQGSDCTPSYSTRSATGLHTGYVSGFWCSRGSPVQLYRINRHFWRLINLHRVDSRWNMRLSPVRKLTRSSSPANKEKRAAGGWPSRRPRFLINHVTERMKSASGGQWRPAGAFNHRADRSTGKHTKLRCTESFSHHASQPH